VYALTSCKSQSWLCSETVRA